MSRNLIEFSKSLEKEFSLKVLDNYFSRYCFFYRRNFSEQTISDIEWRVDGSVISVFELRYGWKAMKQFSAFWDFSSRISLRTVTREEARMRGQFSIKLFIGLSIFSIKLFIGQYNNAIFPFQANCFNFENRTTLQILSK